MIKVLLSAMAIALIGSALPTETTVAGEKPSPIKIFTQPGSPPEEFSIGSGSTAYQGSLDGSIFKSDLRTGRGEVLVDLVEPWTWARLYSRTEQAENPDGVETAR